jgi:hypothetical protein
MKEIRTALKPVMSGIFDAVEGFKGVTLHYPVIVNNEYAGTVAYLIKLEDFLSVYPLFKGYIHSHESFLLDKTGQVITSDVKGYVGQNIFAIEKYALARDDYRSILDSAEPGFREITLDRAAHLAIYQPVSFLNSTWYIVINGREEDAYLGLAGAMSEIWFFTLVVLALLLVLVVATNNLLNRSLRQEVELMTGDIQAKSVQIADQLKRESENSQKLKTLLVELKTSRSDLENKIKELERFQNLTVDRELKMIELKNKLRRLEAAGKED